MAQSNAMSSKTCQEACDYKKCLKLASIIVEQQSFLISLEEFKDLAMNT